MADLVNPPNPAHGLRCKAGTVQTWRRSGLIPCVRPTQRAIRVHLENAKRAMQQLTH